MSVQIRDMSNEQLADAVRSHVDGYSAPVLLEAARRLVAPPITCETSDNLAAEIKWARLSLAHWGLSGSKIDQARIDNLLGELLECLVAPPPAIDREGIERQVKVAMRASAQLHETADKAEWHKAADRAVSRILALIGAAK